MDCGMRLVAAVVAAVLLPLLWALAVQLLWRPHAVARAFARQGIRGPAYRLLIGNIAEAKAMTAANSSSTLDRSSHDFIGRVFPHYQAWMALYGKVFLLWMGPRPTLFVGRYDMVKRILSDKAGVYRKPPPRPNSLALLGTGLVFADGEDWTRHRSVVQPAFAMDKLKTMTGAMAACAGEVIKAWEARALAGGGVATVEAGQGFMEMTRDVISHTVFGSSYRQGKEVFLAQRELQAMAFSSSYSIPTMQYAPTRANLRRLQLNRRVRDMVMPIINDRLASAKEGGGYGADLLGLMLEANVAGDGMSMDEIIDECKTFFFAGHDSTAQLITWATFLLGTHPEWQQRLREEVLREFGVTGTPLHLLGDVLSKLKLVTMVLYETLRLYSAASLIARVAAADADLCGVKVPRGTMLLVPIAMLHRDEEVWGVDAGEFNPLRFKDGVGRAAAHPSAFLSFAFGPRYCIGQDFAMLEAKATLALLLRRFAFEVGPEYVHAPADLLTLQPLHGLPIVLKLLEA
ncbi:unnamed protein product [Urochloa humidicola]